MANRLGPAKPRGVTWNGAGGWVIVSHSRHENFSRTVCITFHCRGITLQRLSDVLAELRQLRRAAAGAALRRRDHGALARQMLGERLTRRSPALERLYRLSPVRSLFGNQLVLSRGHFQIFELKLHLLQKP